MKVCHRFKFKSVVLNLYSLFSHFKKITSKKYFKCAFVLNTSIKSTCGLRSALSKASTKASDRLEEMKVAVLALERENTEPQSVFCLQVHVLLTRSL